MGAGGHISRKDHRTRVLVGAVAVVCLAPILVAYVVLRSPASARLASYDHGHADVRLDGGGTDVYQLTTGGGFLLASDGASLTWTGADGWSLDIYGPSGDPASAVPIEAHGDLAHRGDDFRGWAGFDSKGCTIAYDEVSTTRIAGSIHCHALVLYDQSSVEDIKPLGRPPFDLDVTFEATAPGVGPTPTR